MKIVSIKEFQKNIYEYLKEMPFTITRNGIPFAKITDFKEDKITNEKTTEISRREPKVSRLDAVRNRQIKKGVEICKHGMMMGICKFGCK